MVIYEEKGDQRSSLNLTILHLAVYQDNRFYSIANKPKRLQSHATVDHITFS